MTAGRLVVCLSAATVVACAPPHVSPSAPSPVASQDPPSPVDPRIETVRKLVEAHVKAGLFEGAILVAEGDDILLHEAYGIADRTWGIEHTTQTRFHIGSVGKQMTAAVIMQLIEEGKLDPDATIAELLPSYPAVHASKVTLRSLLNHTSGIPNYTSMPEFRPKSGAPTSRDDVLALFHDKELDFEPGSQFSYNNSAFFLAGVIIEQIEGKHFGRVLHERLFEPLGLEDTGYLFDDTIVPGYAEAYVWTGGGYAAELPTHETWILSNAMIYSDVDDLFAWTQALFEGRPFRASASRDEILELPEGKERNYSFGVGNVPLVLGGKPYRGVGHSGSLGGFRSTQSRIVETGWTVIILSNIGRDQNDLSEQINRVLAGEHVDAPKPLFDRKLATRLEKQGLDEARTWAETVLARDPLEFAVDEAAMNALGYSLLRGGALEDGIFALTLNAELFPGSSNTHDSLGEAYRFAGRPREALEAYERAVALDPANENAKRAVEELTRELDGSEP